MVDFEAIANFFNTHDLVDLVVGGALPPPLLVGSQATPYLLLCGLRPLPPQIRCHLELWLSLGPQICCR
jgi:hypothetical protein